MKIRYTNLPHILIAHFRPFLHWRQWLFLFGTALLLLACSPQAISPDTPVPELPTASPTDPVPTIAPSATPEPGKVLLVAPAGSSAESVRNLLSELSEQEGLTLTVQPELQPDGLDQTIRMVVMSTVPSNLADLLASGSQTQFVVVSNIDLPPASNLSVIRIRPENQAFLAGFISVLLTPDWRSAGLLPSDGPLGVGLQEAYVNGGRYYCGACAPGWPLGVYFPQVAQLPAGSDGPAWQSAAAGLYDNQKVEAYYLSSEAARPELTAYLQGLDQFGRTILLVGEKPPPEELRVQWAASVGFDTIEPLRRVWPDLLAGQGGVVVEAPLSLTDVNPANLGEGRIRLVQELMDEMAAGRIYPFNLPLE